jgi:hypothetical protein
MGLWKISGLDWVLVGRDLFHEFPLVGQTFILKNPLKILSFLGICDGTRPMGTGSPQILKEFEILKCCNPGPPLDPKNNNLP